MPTKGRYVDALDNNNNLLYPKTVATQVIYSPNKSVRKKIEEIDTSVTDVKLSVKAVTDEVVEARDDDTTIHLTLKKRLDSMRDKTNTIEKEVKDARTKNGVVYDSLSDRLSATDGDVTNLKTEINNAKGGEPTLADKINSLSDGNQLTLDEVIEARNGETKLDVRLDKMQQAITEVTNQVTLATTDDLGVTHANLRVRLDKMRKDAKRTDDEVVEARTSVKYPNAPFANLKARLDAMENETDKISSEINDASNGFVSLDDRLDKMQDEIANAVGGNYLPLTGGHMTGDITSNNGFALRSQFNDGSNCNLIRVQPNNEIHVGHDFTKEMYLQAGVTTSVGDLRFWHQKGIKSYDDAGQVGNVANVTNKRLTISNQRWETYIDSDAVLPNGKNFKLTQNNGQSVNALGMDGNNRMYLGSNVPLTIQGSEVYCSARATFAEGMNIDNNRPIFFKKPDGTPMSMLTYTNAFHVGETQTRMHLYGNGISVHGNLTPDYSGTVKSWDLGWSTSRWTTIWGKALNIERITSDNAHLSIDKPTTVNGEFVAQDGQIRTNGWGKSMIMSTGQDHTYLHNTSANSYLTFYDNGQLRYSGSFIISGNFAPNGHGQHWIGLDNQAFWGMRCTGGGFNQVSDGTQKEDIRNIQDEDFFNMIKDVEVKSYLYKQPQCEVSTLELEEDKEPRTQDNVEDNDLNVGIIAQDMAKHDVSKYVLNHSEEGGYSINLYNYSASLHSALRYEISKREELEKEFAEFKELVNKKLGVI